MNNRIEEDSIIVTGCTLSYRKEKIVYITPRYFEKINNINRRTLGRYRTQIANAKADHRRFFIKKNGGYWYSNYILELRRYRKSNKKDELLPEDLIIDFSTTKHNSIDSSLYKQLRKIPWTYIGGGRYDGKKEVYQCVDKMRVLYNSMKNEFPDFGITLYYTTEYKNGSYHNHFIFSFSKGSNKSTIRLIKKHLRRLGTSIPYADFYDSKFGEEDYLKYMTKEVFENPDGWGVITNSVRESKVLFDYKLGSSANQHKSELEAG